MCVDCKLASPLVTARAAHTRGLWIAFVVVVLTTALAARQSPAAGGERRNIAALPATAQSQIFAAIGEDQRAFHAVAGPGGFRLDNASHALSAEFTVAGVEFRHGSSRWSLMLSGYGYGDTLRATNETAPTAHTNRVEYRRGELTEWYLNSPLGVEQGFTLERAPKRTDGKPLTIAFILSGDLTPSVIPGARTLTLKKDGAVALRYSGLTAWDADRRELRGMVRDRRRSPARARRRQHCTIPADDRSVRASRETDDGKAVRSVGRL